MFKRNDFKVCAFLTLLLTLSFPASANEIKQYRLPHSEICFEVGEFKIECGNFRISSTILSKKYRTISEGADVLSSFSAKTHPGDHAFLNRLATRLGYIDSDPKSITNKPINEWAKIPSSDQTTLIDRYSSIATTDELKKALITYLNLCINYWAHPDATHDKRERAPMLAEVSALCIADSGVLDTPAPQ